MQITAASPAQADLRHFGSVEYDTQMYFGESPEDLRGACDAPDRQGRKRASYCMKLPHELEQASINFEVVRAGMLLTVLDFTPASDMAVNFKSEASPINFGAILAGKYDIKYNSFGVSQKYLSGTPRELIGKSCDASGTFSMAGGKRLRMLSLTLDESLIEELLYGHEDYEVLVKKLNTRRRGLNVVGSWELSADMNVIASQILHCRLNGLNRKIYLESKALEILALQLDKLADKKNASISISKNDIRQLYEAKDILLAELENPPSLKELASRVGINDFKLKQGFKEIFGDTAYGLLRKQRMETARSLLLDGEASVGDAASAVGYTNISHFITAFRKQYNVTPGGVLQQSRKIYRLSH